ncbi:MAG: pentapeptide repeat-containing protein [bacterium]
MEHIEPLKQDLDQDNTETSLKDNKSNSGVDQVLFPRKFVEIRNQQFYEKDTEKIPIDSLDFSNHHFIDVSGFGVVFRNCNFSYSIFERGYFRNSKFINCKFIGCYFTNCNLRGATFESCNLHYVRFKETLLHSDSLIKSLPIEPSTRRENLQNLRINARAIGDEKGIKTYIKKELCAEREHFRKARKKNEDYYAMKYGGFKNGIKVRYQSIMIWLDYYIWGHGEYLKNLILFITAIIVILSLIGAVTSSHFNFGLSLNNLSSLFYNSFKATFCIFLGINIKLNNIIGLKLTVIIVLIRYVTLGLLVSMLFRSLSKR